MKALLFILTMFITTTSFAQYKDLDKMHKEQRDKILIEIASKVINHVSDGYIREGAKPVIKDFGIIMNVDQFEFSYIFKEHIGKHLYSIEYPLTDEELKFFIRYKKDYLVKIYILAETSRAILITYADSHFGFGIPKTFDKPEKHIKKYAGLEAYKARRKKAVTTTTITRLRTGEESARYIDTRDSIRRTKGWSEVAIIRSRIRTDSMERRPSEWVKYTKKDLEEAIEKEKLQNNK